MLSMEGYVWVHRLSSLGALLCSILVSCKILLALCPIHLVKKLLLTCLCFDTATCKRILALTDDLCHMSVCQQALLPAGHHDQLIASLALLAECILSSALLLLIFASPGQHIGNAAEAESAATAGHYLWHVLVQIEFC